MQNSFKKYGLNLRMTEDEYEEILHHLRVAYEMKVGDRIIVLKGTYAGQYGTFEAITGDGNLVVTIEGCNDRVTLGPFAVELAEYLPQIRII
jgi:transcription antitermination factor NusG